MKQIRMTYDPELMQADQLLGLLPREFDRWTKAAPTPASATKPAPGLLSRIFGRSGSKAAGPSPT